MIEFRNLVYLDLQKTATTSIAELLRAIVDEPEIDHGVHRAAMPGHDLTKFHFISVRDPLAIYISLFSYGCTGQGGMYAGFRKRGLEHLYQPSLAGFETWAAFMLEAANARQIKRAFDTAGIAALCGPITFRLLMLSMIDPVTTLRGARLADRDALRSLFERRRMYDRYVRVEHLVGDLLDTLHACADRATFKSLPATRDDLEAILPRSNTSMKIPGLARESVPDDLAARIREREWLMCETFGYDRARSSAPPPLPLREAACIVSHAQAD